MASYNAKYGTSLNYSDYPYLLSDPALIEQVYTSEPGMIGDSFYMPHPYSRENDSAWENCWGYWTSTPATHNDYTYYDYETGYEEVIESQNVWAVYCFNSLNGNDSSHSGLYAVRPVVSLPSSMQVTSTASNGTTIWSLVQ